MNRILVERMKERMGNSLRLLIFRPVNSCISTVRAGLGGQNGSKLFSGYANENNKVFEELDFPYYFVGKKLQDRLICQTLAQAVVRGDSDVFDKWRMFRYRQMLGISYFLYHTSGTIIQSLILSQSRAQCIVRGETDLLAEAKQRRSIQIYINNKAFEKSYFPYEKSDFPYSVGKKTQKRLIWQSLSQAVVCGDSDIFNKWRMFRYQKMLSRSIFPYNSSGMRIQTLLLSQRQAQCVVRGETDLLAEVKFWLSLQIYTSVQGSLEIGVESCSSIIHLKVWKTGQWQKNSLVISVVVNAYGNAGFYEEAQQFFLLSGSHGFLANNAMLWIDAQYVPHVAPKRFYQMMSNGFYPARSTIQAVLYAADVGGLVFEAAQILGFLKEYYGIARYQLTIHHYTSLLAMLMRVGQFDNAMELLDCMPYKVTQDMVNAVFGLCKSNEEAQKFVNYLVRKRVRYMILPQNQLLFEGVTWSNGTIAQADKDEACMCSILVDVRVTVANI